MKGSVGIERRVGLFIVAAVAASISACRHEAPTGPPRVSGYVEATEIRIASKVPGRLESVWATEGARVQAGDKLVAVATTDTDLALRRAHAERDQASANVRLLEAGSRPEDIRQAEAQVAAAGSDRRAAVAELESARADEARFEQLLQNRAGSQKQRDDAVTRRQLAEAKVAAADDRFRAATAGVDRLKAGARPEELAAARARVAAIDAEIATLQHDKDEAIVVSPSAGVISQRLVEPGELITRGQPLVVLVDLDHAWANAYVEEPLIPQIVIDGPVTVVTDAGDRLPGKVAFVSPRAEFTPRNVQTAAERAKLVYRVKVTVDNTRGLLKPGMPVEVELGSGK